VLEQITRRHQQVFQLYQQGDYGQALRLARQARELARQHLGEEHPEVATALDNLGLLYKTLGQYAREVPRSREPLSQALDITRASLGHEHPQYARSLSNLAALYEAMGFYRRRLAGTSRAEALREAQLALKARDPRPFTWGAFICQGDPGPLPP
jgi:tetratricopeptide (TPR) repeat protein